MAQHSTFSILVLSALLLSGCAQLSSPPFLVDSSKSYLFESTPSKRTLLSPNTPGVAISQTQPPRLESIAFFSNSQLNVSHTTLCIERLIPLPDDKTTAYIGRDIVNTPGSITIHTQALNLLLSEHTIIFQLSVFGQSNGIHYGFSQLQLTRAAAVDVTNHSLHSISPTSPNAQLVYQSLEMLYQQLDECMAEGRAEVEDQ